MKLPNIFKSFLAILFLSLSTFAIQYSIFVPSAFSLAMPPGSNTSASTSSDPIPPPYVKCGNTDKPEFHSLRPYQASPCEVPIKENEQALLCGNDLVVNDIINHPQDPHRCLNCLPPPCCACTVLRDFVAPREFIVAFNAYESELPIAGNTELIPAGKSSSLAVNEKRLTEWKNHLPPEASEYDDFTEYWIDYQDWRGRKCQNINPFSALHIPLLNKEIFICFDDLTESNFWSNLFPYIPYSSTEDRIGKARVYDMIWDQGKSSVDSITPNPPSTNWNPNPPDYGADPNILTNETPLYFPHMEENVELTNLLQSSFLPAELLEKNQPLGEVDPVQPDNAECKILDVRYNPGDQLFGEKAGDLGVPNANVTYDAYYQCYVTYPPPPPWGGTCDNYVELHCRKNSWFHSDVETFTPMIDELFSKTVAGNASVVKKIFPQIQPEAPIQKIKDIPASTNVEHQYQDVQSHVDLISEPASFYIPHFGSIYDYFLQNIQTALRPQGFGGQSAGLSPDKPIAEADRVNEYLSWYLNGTLFRAEGDPLSYKDPEDVQRLIGFSGPLNKLLPQAVQWRTKLLQKPTTDVKVSRVGEVERAKENRHDQIAACTIGIKIPSWIPFIGGKELGAFPIACSKKELASIGLVPDVGPGPSPTAGTCPSVPDSAVESKYLGEMKNNFIRMAGGYGGCDLAEECYNYVVSGAKKAGVNPALTLTLWLHESGASSYCTNSGVEDFGVHYIPGEDIVGQLETWLQIAKASVACSISCGTGGWSEPMQAFLCNYRSGECDPNNCGDTDGDGTDFYDKMREMFQWVTDPVAYCLDAGGAGFKINCPNDMGCP